MEKLIVQTAVGDYRQKVLEELVKVSGTSFMVLTGKEYFEPSTKTKVNLPGNLYLVKNFFLFKRRLLFQYGVFFKAVSAKSLILEMNPRIISNWLILLSRKMLGRKTVLWGHAWPRAGRYSKSDNLRNVLRELGSCIIVYTESQRLELEQRMPGKLIIAAPNSLYRKSDMYSLKGKRENFIYVGRLVASKKPQLLISGFSRFVEMTPNFSGRLIIVGEGPEKADLLELCKELGISDKVSFEGHISELEILRDYYANSICSVSPGYVGLSITQSFSFGVPILISKDEPHAPEIEAAIDGSNCMFFNTDDSDDLAKKLAIFYSNLNEWESKKKDILEHCKLNYSVEHMANRINQAFLTCKN